MLRILIFNAVLLICIIYHYFYLSKLSEFLDSRLQWAERCHSISGSLKLTHMSPQMINSRGKKTSQCLPKRDLKIIHKEERNPLVPKS